MHKVKSNSLNICEKCGNVMVTKVIRRAKNPHGSELEKILQCVICRHWKALD